MVVTIKNYEIYVHLNNEYIILHHTKLPPDACLKQHGQKYFLLLHLTCEMYEPAKCANGVAC